MLNTIENVRKLCEKYEDEHKHLITNHHFFYRTDSFEESERLINKELIEMGSDGTELLFRNIKASEVISS
tara:strand:+ start:404 stop:613 length:210 start_codon:yes stop_codon:yes gene_type:complete